MSNVVDIVPRLLKKALDKVDRVMAINSANQLAQRQVRVELEIYGAPHAARLLTETKSRPGMMVQIAVLDCRDKWLFPRVWTSAFHGRLILHLPDSRPFQPPKQISVIFCQDNEKPYLWKWDIVGYNAVQANPR